LIEVPLLHTSFVAFIVSKRETFAEKGALVCPGLLQLYVALKCFGNDLICSVVHLDKGGMLLFCNNTVQRSKGNAVACSV